MISLNNIGKEYTLLKHKSTTLKEVVLKGAFTRDQRSKFWALRGVDLEIAPGEACAIIGPNGSGKSTLLNIIAGITTPSEGEAAVEGIVAPLIELGVGFNSEFTGMENIFLNGILLGMTREELLEKCDSIIDFAGLRKFIYNPVHTYSSGMEMRLGFSVAMHSDADIFLFDEIMTVGDNIFREKCRQELHRLRERGKTIVMVTHDFGVVQELCDRMIRLDKGRVVDEGSADEVTSRYFNSFYDARLEDMPQSPFDEHEAVTQDHVRMGNGRAAIERLRLFDERGFQTWQFKPGETITIEMDVACREPLPSLDCHIGIHSDPQLIFTLIRSSHQGVSWRNVEGRRKLRVTLSDLPLAPADYSLSVAIAPVESPHDPYDLQLRLYSFRVIAPARGLPPAAAPLQLSTREAVH